ncbi:MAG: hypothetical protein JWP32_2724 [Schumannella sp.]|nr:hypothetical protein [Schumannella sp.]
MAMQHHERDGVAAVSRARTTYRNGWHPLNSAVEVEPGTWWLVGQYDNRYAIIVLLEIGGERGYRVVTGERDPGERRLVGYFRTLRGAAERGHARWLASQARPGGINGG